jgi:hypothetical protein
MVIGVICCAASANAANLPMTVGLVSENPIAPGVTTTLSAQSLTIPLRRNGQTVNVRVDDALFLIKVGSLAVESCGSYHPFDILNGSAVVGKFPYAGGLVSRASLAAVKGSGFIDFATGSVIMKVSGTIITPGGALTHVSGATSAHLQSPSVAVLHMDGSVSVGATVQGCQFSHPRRAAQLQASLTQAFVSCYNPGGNTPNATTEGGIPSCAPPETFAAQNGHANGWFLGPRGSGSVRLKTKANAPRHPYNALGSTGDVIIALALKDVRNGAGLANGEARLTILIRATIADHADGDMTVVDFPLNTSVTVVAGAVNVQRSVDAILNAMDQPGLPACSNVEVLSVSVADENGDTFANMGVLLP